MRIFDGVVLTVHRSGLGIVLYAASYKSCNNILDDLRGQWWILDTLRGVQKSVFMSRSTEVSDCRKRVAERWGTVNYRDLNNDIQTEEESECSTDIEARDTKRARYDFIDLTKSDDEAVNDNCDEKTAENTPFKLMRSDIYDVGVESPHLIGLEDLFKDESLVSCVLFSFQFEMDFLMEYFLDDIEKITIVAQKGTITPLTSPRLIRKLRIIEIYMPPYTCHHTKMVINFYRDGSCKMFLPSNNFTYAETNFPQQVCWCSPTLYLARDARYVKNKSLFQDNLVDYIESYEKKELTTLLVPVIKQLDFEPLRDVQFVFSAPSKRLKSGLKLLADIILPLNKKGDVNSSKHYLCQSSTIGAPVSKKTHGNLFTHIFIPLLEGLLSKGASLPETDILLENFRKAKISPYILYPTVEEIRTSPAGWLSSGWFHFNHLKDDLHYKLLLNEFHAFYKQDLTNTSQERKATPSHSKFYMKSTATEERHTGRSRFEKLDWCLYTSANLSFNAWGNTKGFPRNYEAGVLLTNENGNLNCRSFNDVIYNRFRLKNLNDGETPSISSTIVMIPFTLPLVQYDAKNGDEAFCLSKNYDLVDINGRPYEP